VTEDFRKFRRDRLLICAPRGSLSGWRRFVRDFKARKSPPDPVQKKTEPSAATSAQFVQVNPWIPHLGGLHQFIPGEFASTVGSRARHHAGKGRFRALGRLIMEITGRDAFNEGLLLFRVGEFE